MSTHPNRECEADVHFRQHYLLATVAQNRTLKMGACVPVDGDFWPSEGPALESIYVDLYPTVFSRSALEAFAEDGAKGPSSAPRAILLGDPGSGKTTFLRHLALCLASAQVCEAQLRDDWLFRIPNWPEPSADRLPILIHLGQFVNWLGERPLSADGIPLFFEYLKHVWEEVVPSNGSSIDGQQMSDYLRRNLACGRAVLLLDDLDAIEGKGADTILLAKALELNFPQVPIVATCHLRYLGPHRLQEPRGWVVHEIQDYSAGERRQFIKNWYSLSVKRNEKSYYQSRARDLIQATNSPDMAALAARPLLLTILASVHRQRGSLPTHIADLTSMLADRLLLAWPAYDTSSDIDRKKLLDSLGALTLEAYDNVSPSERVTIPEGKLRDALEGLPAGLMAQIGEGHGLLKKGGLQTGVFVYPHISLQWFVVIRYLSEKEDVVSQCLTLARELEALGWEVVSRVVAGLNARGREGAALELIGRLCLEEPVLNKRNSSLVLLAIRCLEEVEFELGAAKYKDLPASYHRTMQLVQRELAALFKHGYLSYEVRLKVFARLSNLEGRFSLGPMIPESWAKIPEQVTFTMGAREDEEGREDEGPTRQVTLSPYLIGVYPVTEFEYQRFIQSSPGVTSPEHWDEWRVCPKELRDNPVVNVTWTDANAYCCWLTRMLAKEWVDKDLHGLKASLPTEAQWEYAARGPERLIWPWGNRFQRPNTDLFELDRSATYPVGLFPGRISPLGCHDMAGNVWEWCQDWYGPYDAHPLKDPVGTLEWLGSSPEWDRGSLKRVLRGGAWASHVRDWGCRGWHEEHCDGSTKKQTEGGMSISDWLRRGGVREKETPYTDFTGDDIGFRVVLSKVR